MADISSEFSSKADADAFNFLRECSVEDFFTTQYHKSSYADLNDEQKNLCIQAAIDKRRADVIEIALKGGLPDAQGNATGYVMRAINTGAYDVARLLIANPEVCENIDQYKLMEYQLVFCNEPDMLEDLFKAGIKLPLSNDLSDTAQQKCFKSIGKIGIPEAISVIEQYQPEIFAAPAALINICHGAIERGNNKMLNALEDSFFDKFDYEKMVEHAVDIFKHNPRPLKWLHERRDRAQAANVQWFKELDLSDEEAQLMHEMASLDSDQTTFDVFTSLGVFNYAVREGALEAAKCILNVQPFDADNASKWMESYVSRFLATRSVGASFDHDVVRHLLLNGASPTVNRGRLLKHAAQTDLNLLMVAMSHVKDIKEIEPFVNEMLAAAYRGKNMKAVQYIESKFENVRDLWDGSAIQAACESMDATIFNHALSYEDEEKGQLIRAKKMADIVAKYPSMDYNPDRVRFYTDMVGKLHKPLISTEMLLSIASHEKNVAVPAEWLGLMLRKAEDYTPHEMQEHLLLEAAKNAMRQGTPDRDVFTLAEKSGIVGPGLTEMLSAAISLKREDVGRMMRSYLGARLFNVDWDVPEDDERYEGLETFRKNNKVLFDAEGVRDGPDFNTGNAMKITDKEAWLKVDDEGLCVLKRASYHKNFTAMLSEYEDKTGNRFTAEELLKPMPHVEGSILLGHGHSPFVTMCKFQNHVEFMTHSYWDKDVDGLKRLYEHLPEFAKRDLGREFAVKMNSRHVRKRMRRPKLG